MESLGMSSSQKPSDQQAGRRRSWALKLVVLLVLLLALLVGLALFWPVPSTEQGVGQNSRRQLTGAGTLSIGDATTRVAHEVRLGERALPLAVTVTLDNAGPARTFDSHWLRVEVDETELLPLSESREGVGLVSNVPRKLEEGLSDPITVVFAVPSGSTEATVLLQAGEMRPEDASKFPVRIPQEADR